MESLPKSHILEPCLWFHKLIQNICFPSESVTDGHPDKVADQISDSILDAIISKDPNARVDCVTLIMQGNIIVTGQITTSCNVSIPNVVRKTRAKQS